MTNYKKSLAQDAVLVLREFFSPEEVKVYREECERLWESQEDKVPQNLRLGLRTEKGGEIVLDRLDPVEDISDVFRQLNQNEKLMAVIENIFAEPAMVMKEKLIYKTPGTSGFGAHRDAPYFCISGVPDEKTVSVSIALDAANEENGCIQFYPELRDKKLKSLPHEERDISDDEIEGIEPLAPCLQPGDVVIFDSLVPHRSGFNHSTESRRTYLITYVPANYPDSRKKYYEKRFQQQQAERESEIEGPFYVK